MDYATPTAASQNRQRQRHVQSSSPSPRAGPSPSTTAAGRHLGSTVADTSRITTRARKAASGQYTLPGGSLSGGFQRMSKSTSNGSIASLPSPRRGLAARTVSPTEVQQERKRVSVIKTQIPSPIKRVVRPPSGVPPIPPIPAQPSLLRRPSPIKPRAVSGPVARHRSMTTSHKRTGSIAEKSTSFTSPTKKPPSTAMRKVSQLQPISLPPLNLQALSTPTVKKVNDMSQRLQDLQIQPQPTLVAKPEKRESFLGRLSRSSSRSKAKAKREKQDLEESQGNTPPRSASASRRRLSLSFLKGRLSPFGNAPAQEPLPPPPKIPLHLQADPADEEMRRTVVRRKGSTYLQKEEAALLALQQRAQARQPVACEEVESLEGSALNVYERGEVVDYDGKIYFTGAPALDKQGGRLDAPNHANFGYDDERGDYLIHPGDHFAYRYEIVDILGKGSFGQVMRCIDYKTGSLVAIKTIRNKKRFHAQALVEVNILQQLREWDPEDKHCMIRYTDHFYFRHHLCIATNLLGMNLYEYIKANEFRGCSLGVIRSFTRQILSCLELLGRHRVIHCDLKPENILLVNVWESKIKIIDFGSSCFEDQKVYTYIQSRFYRSPEVILGMSYGLPIDIWSMGCILAELYTGYPIFPGEDEQEQLSCIMELFGPPEKHLIENSTRKKLFFDAFGKPRPVVSSRGRKRRPSSKTLAQALKCQDEAFVDFLTRCLRWNPEHRLTPGAALSHPFVTGQAMPPQQEQHQQPQRQSVQPVTYSVSNGTPRVALPRKFEQQHRRIPSGLPVKSRG